MLTEAHIERTLREYVPDDVKIVFEESASYLLVAAFNPLVQDQIRRGIYSFQNLPHEFLGWAYTLTEERELHVCTPLLANLVDGLTDELVDVLVRHTGAHEAHHLDHHHDTVDVAAQLDREHSCEAAVRVQHPHLADRIRHVYQDSPVYRRVFARARALQV